MLITRDYMLKKGSGPSGAKLFLDTKVVPMAANMAGALEVALERASVRTGVRSSVILAGIAGAVSLTVLRLIRGPKKARRSV